MDWKRHLSADPQICHGRPCIRGTRVMVSVVLDNLAAGMSVSEIVDSYPPVTAADVQATLAYAAELVHGRMVDLDSIAG